jgi:hypothetical protein
MQEIARYNYNISKTESNRKQVIAHQMNRYLLKPREGMTFQKLKINKNRVENIKNWIQMFENFDELKSELAETLVQLDFGVKADKFEAALHELGKILGFESERPDKAWKEGPDNLWNLSNKDYILFECKNEVKEDRAEIYKEETGQMNNSCAWFNKNYSGDNVKRIMIIPTKTISKAAGFTQSVEIMRKSNLNKLKKNIDNFFNEFKIFDLHSLTDSQITEFLSTHKLEVKNIINDYSEEPFQKS